MCVFYCLKSCLVLLLLVFSAGSTLLHDYGAIVSAGGICRAVFGIVCYLIAWFSLLERGPRSRSGLCVLCQVY